MVDFKKLSAALRDPEEIKRRQALEVQRAEQQEAKDKADRAIVDALVGVESGLSDWEMGFADSLWSWVRGQGRNLSDKQRAKAESILTKLGL